MAPSKRVLSVATANDSGSDAPVDKKRARIERKEKAVGAALSGTRKVAAPRRRNEQVKVEANILEESPAVQEEIKERESMHPASQHHVYCVRPPAFYHENVGQTAGLFNCINVTEFYDLCYALRSVLKSLRFHQENNYGYHKTNTKAGEKNPHVTEIITFAENEFQAGDLPLDATTDPAMQGWRNVLKCEDMENWTRYPIGTHTTLYRAVVIWFRHAYVAINLVKTTFPHAFSGPADPALSKTVHGLNTEDINRFYHLINYVKNKDRAYNSNAKAPMFLDNLAPNVRISLAKTAKIQQALFKFHTGPPLPNASERSQQEYASGIAKFMQRLAGAPELAGSRGEGDHANPDGMDSFVNTFTAVVGGGGSKKKKKKGLTGAIRRLAAIAPEHREGILSGLHGALTVLHDRTEAMAREGALSSAEAREASAYANMLTELQQGDDESAPHDAELHFNKAQAAQKLGEKALEELSVAYGVADGELETLTLDAAVEMVNKKKVTQLFQKFQSSINSVSAVPPDYHDVVKRFAMTIAPVEKEDEGIPVVLHNNTRLLPHQVVGVGFIVDMLLSHLRTALLADETGLGKTVQALAASDHLNRFIGNGLRERGLLGDPDDFVDFLPESPSTAARAGQYRHAHKKGKKRATDYTNASDSDDFDAAGNAESDVDEDSTSELGDSSNEDTDDEAEGRHDAKTFLPSAYYSDATRAAMARAIADNEQLIKETVQAGCEYFMPTVVYAPAGSTAVWLKEIGERFKNRRLLSYLPAGTTSRRSTQGEEFVGSGVDLENYIRSLPVNNPLTADVIIVTSYTIATSRFLRKWFVEDNGERHPLSRLTKEECERESIPIAELADQMTRAEELKMDGMPGRVMYELRIRPGIFVLAIWDEAHKMKNIETQALYTLLQMKHKRQLLLTASPFMRRLKDLSTILQVVHETSIAEADVPVSEAVVLEVHDYDRLKDVLKAAGGNYVKADPAARAELFKALNPRPYASLMNSFDDTPSVVRRVVPVPLGILALRRVTGQTMMISGVPYIIAGDIPAFHCTVVELEPNDRERLLYRRAHVAKCSEPESHILPAQPHARGLHIPLPPPAETEVRDNVDKRRRLQTASNNAGLDNLYQFSIPAKAKVVQQWYETLAGESASFVFYHHATDEGWGPVPTERVSQATYITAVSSKTQYVIREAQRLQKQKKKLLVYCDWPTNVWLLKTLLDILDMKAHRISAGQTPKERVRILNRFDNPTDEEYMILVCSSRSAAESINLQMGCHNIIIMDIVNLNTILQIIGRCYRIGQKFEQFIKILLLNDSYDQFIFATYAKAFVSQLAATSGGAMSTISDEDCQQALDDDATFKQRMEMKRQNTQQSIIDETREALYDIDIHKKLRRNFGLRSDRDGEEWFNIIDPMAKLAIPEEREFFTVMQGAVGQRARTWVRKHAGGEEIVVTPSKAALEHAAYSARKEARTEQRKARELKQEANLAKQEEREAKKVAKLQKQMAEAQAKLDALAHKSTGQQATGKKGGPAPPEESPSRQSSVLTERPRPALQGSAYPTWKSAHQYSTPEVEEDDAIVSENVLDSTEDIGTPSRKSRPGRVRGTKARSRREEIPRVFDELHREKSEQQPEQQAVEESRGVADIDRPGDATTAPPALDVPSSAYDAPRDIDMTDAPEGAVSPQSHHTVQDDEDRPHSAYTTPGRVAEDMLDIPTPPNNLDPPRDTDASPTTPTHRGPFEEEVDEDGPCQADDEGKETTGDLQSPPHAGETIDALQSHLYKEFSGKDLVSIATFIGCKSVNVKSGKNKIISKLCAFEHDDPTTLRARIEEWSKGAAAYESDDEDAKSESEQGSYGEVPGTGSRAGDDDTVVAEPASGPERFGADEHAEGEDL